MLAVRDKRGWAHKAEVRSNNLPARTPVSNEVVLLGRGQVESVVDVDRTHIDVVVGRCWSVDNDGPSNTVTVLRYGVRVIPRCSVLRQLHRVGTRKARRDGALSNTGHSVLVIGALLGDTCCEVSVPAGLPSWDKTYRANGSWSSCRSIGYGQ